MGYPAYINTEAATHLLSYKPISNIEIDTTHYDMQLGTDNFTIMFDIIPYPDLNIPRNPVCTLDQIDLSQVAQQNRNIYGTNANSLLFTGMSNEDFFPIFTSNKTLLYDSTIIDTVDLFYNVHCCYIYKRKLHLLINDLSDIPLLHLSVDLTLTTAGGDVSSESNLTCLLTRNGNVFTLEVKGILSQYYTKYNFNFESKTINLDLNNFNTGKFFIGYAERYPTGYGYHYFNSLNGYLNTFKIFKGVVKSYKKMVEYASYWAYVYTPDIGDYTSIYGSYYYVGAENGDWSYRQINKRFLSNATYDVDKFDNITRNSKYYIGGKVYNNIQNNKCKVNWLYDKETMSDYKIVSIKNIEHLFIDYLDALKSQNYNDGYGYTQDLQDDITYATTHDKIPIITFELEKPFDTTSIDFLKEEYVFACEYDENNVYYSELINSDYTSINDIQNLSSYYDIFINIISGSSTYLNKKYLIDKINERIADYINNGIVVTNIRIHIKNNQYLSCRIHYTFLPNQKDSILKNLNVLGYSDSLLTKQTANCSDRDNLYKLLIRSNSSNTCFYKMRLSNYYRDINSKYFITQTDAEDVTFTTKENQCKFSNWYGYPLESIEFIQLFSQGYYSGTGTAVRLYSYTNNFYNMFFDDEMKSLGTSTTTIVYFPVPILYGKIVQPTPVESIRLDDMSSPMTTMQGYKFAKVSIEDTEGNEICSIFRDVSNNLPSIYRELIKHVTYKQVVFNIYKIVATLNNGIKFILGEIDSTRYCPCLIAQKQCRVLEEGEVPEENVESFNDNNFIDATVTGNILTIKFDESRFNLTDNNFLQIYYYSGLGIDDKINPPLDTTIPYSHLLNDIPILSDMTNYSDYYRTVSLLYKDIRDTTMPIYYTFDGNKYFSTIANTENMIYDYQLSSLDQSIIKHPIVINNDNLSWYIK